jgi:hypothetical protein
MTAHTPTPWKQLNKGMVATSDESAVVGTFHNANGGPDNAAHIVRCVNAHDELVAALASIENWATHAAEGTLLRTIYDEARAALAKVQS